jgi:hypothetical protein
MLPLHITFKIFAFVAISSLVFISCSDHSKKDIELIKALNEGLESSNRAICTESIEALTSLQSKLYEFGSVERAQVWFPKAEKIQQLSKDIFDYIENIKQKIGDRTVNSSILFDKLKLYREQILEIDQKIANEFEKSLPVFTSSIDSSKNDSERLFKDYFKNTSSEAVIAMLNKIENNVRINELRIITFCNENVGCLDCGPHYAFGAIAIQSSSIVESGEQLEITAGMGYFTVEPTPEIFIFGRPVKIQEDGAVHYKIKAPLKSGKYYVPVKINYTDQNGRKQSIQKEIEYTVANIQEQ